MDKLQQLATKKAKLLKELRTLQQKEKEAKKKTQERVKRKIVRCVLSGFDDSNELCASILSCLTDTEKNMLLKEMVHGHKKSDILPSLQEGVLRDKIDNQKNISSK